MGEREGRRGITVAVGWLLGPNIRVEFVRAFQTKGGGKVASAAETREGTRPDMRRMPNRTGERERENVWASAMYCTGRG